MRDPSAAAASAGTAAPAPFLTDEQRHALDQALAQKAAEQAKARAAANRAAAASGERKNRSGKAPGAPKKGGGGGKFTWGNLMSTEDPRVALDRNDPNYDSEEEQASGHGEVVLRAAQSKLRSEILEYKEEVRTIVEEYYTAGSIADVADSLEDLGAPHLAHYFVKRLLTAALDKHDREREMASTLLSSLYAEVISGGQVLKGFLSLIHSLEDLVLDVPEAPELLSRFVLRGIVDDVLPPAIVTHISADAGPASQDLKQRIESQLAARHSAEKVLRCWGGQGTGMSYSDTKAAISLLLEEYLASLDAAEASRRLRALALPFFHHELVKQALVAAMDKPAMAQACVELLARLSSTNEVSGVQLAKGVARVRDNLQDMVLDNPAVAERWELVSGLAKAAGLTVTVEAVEADGGAQGGDAAAANGNGQHAAADGSGPASAGGSAGGAAGAAAAPVAPPPGVAAFKRESVMAIREYFDSQDVAEVARRLSSLDEPGLHALFVKAAVSLALDRKDREREMVSVLLRALTPQTISADQVAAGFTRLLLAANDLVLDVPDAVRLLGLFLGRAVVDELMPPAFLAQVLGQLDGDDLGVAVVRSAGALLGARHGAERVLNCWHGGAALLPLADVKARLRELLQEYLVSGDVSEVARSLLELEVPDYLHQFVLMALEAAYGRYSGVPEGGAAAEPAGGQHCASAEAAAAPVAALLGALSTQGVLTQTQVAKGVERAKEALADEVLDYGPGAKEVLQWLTAKGTEEGWLQA